VREKKCHLNVNMCCVCCVQISYIQQPYTHLVPELKGVDPDDAFSIVPYEKGSNLLMYLEQKLGGAGQ